MAEGSPGFVSASRAARIAGSTVVVLVAVWLISWFLWPEGTIDTTIGNVKRLAAGSARGAEPHLSDVEFPALVEPEGSTTPPSVPAPPPPVVPDAADSADPSGSDTFESRYEGPSHDWEEPTFTNTGQFSSAAEVARMCQIWDETGGEGDCPYVYQEPGA